MHLNDVLLVTYTRNAHCFQRLHHLNKNTHSLARLISTERALDTVIWQLIASVAAPGYTIHTIVALTLAALTSLESLEGVQQSLQVCEGGTMHTGCVSASSTTIETTLVLLPITSLRQQQFPCQWMQPPSRSW